MATFAEELVDDLVTQTIATTKGTDIFYNELPDTDISPTTVIAVQEVGGEVSDGPPWPWLSVQFLVRSATDWDTASETAWLIYDRYNELANTSLPTYRILAAMATTLPQYLGVDTRMRYLVSLNIDFRVVAITQVVGGTGYGGSKDPNIAAV